MAQEQGINTYRGYVLVRNTADPHKPTTVVGYIRAPKYGDAWKAGRAIAGGKPEAGSMFADQECKRKLELPKDAVFVACDDLRVRNVKLDRKALEAIINDPKATAEDKVKAMSAMVAGAGQQAAPAA